jgi:hypothetical protein
MKYSLVIVVILGAVALAQSVIGSFRYEKASDPLNDGDRSLIWTQESRDPKRAAQLQFRCQENNRSKVTDLYVALQHKLQLPEYYAQYSRVRWQYRFDSALASDNWLSYFSEDGSRIYMADNAREDFIKTAHKSQRLVVVITGDEIAAQTYQFNLDKFSDALAKLKCKVETN